MSIESLPVIFRADRSGEVTAVFPTLCHDSAGLYFTIYAHVGQHGGAGLDWYNRTRAARPDEYADLLAELRDIYGRTSGPDDPPVNLIVRYRFSRAYRDAWQADARRSRTSQASA